MIRRSFFPAIVFLCSTMLNAQVIIKEKMEIRPKGEFPVSSSSSSENLPYFEGSIVPNSRIQGISVRRSCTIVGTGTLTSGGPFNVSILIILGTYPNEANLTNATGSIQGICGAWVPLELWTWTSAGIVITNVEGTISGNQATYNFTGYQSFPHPINVPFTANVTLQAVPVGNSDPSNIVMSANPTVLSSSGIEGNDLSSSLSATVYDGDGNPVQYCGTASMVFTIENPIEGVTLRGTGSDGLPREGTSIEANFAQSSSSATFVWDGKTLSEDSVMVRVRAEGFGLSATQDITLKLKKPVIKLSVQNAELRPLKAGIPNTTTVIVEAKRNDEPAAGIPIQLEVKPVPGSGGHDHFDNRPKGTLAAESGTSDLSGKFTTTFTASEIAGVEWIVASSEQAEKKDSGKVEVKVSDLIALEASMFFELVGAPSNYAGTNDPCRGTPPGSQHSVNHFGTGAMIAAIHSIAAAYDSLHSGVRLRINDMSLELGGLFDFRNNWRTPHREHRVGRNADVGFRGISQQGICVPLNTRRLRRIIQEKTNIEPLPESDHYHIYSN